MARASSLPLEAVSGTAGWRRAGVIPTAGAGRRSRRWLRGAPAQAKEGQEAVRAGGGGPDAWGGGRALGEAGERSRTSREVGSYVWRGTGCVWGVLGLWKPQRSLPACLADIPTF